MFIAKCDADIKPESIKEGEKIYMNPEHFLQMSRFLPKTNENKGQKGKNKGQKGGNKNDRGANRGRNRGGYRPPRGGPHKPQAGKSSGAYRPPRRNQQ